MKNFLSGYRYAVALLILSFLSSFSTVNAQIVVEQGWKDHDSIFCSAFGLAGFGMYPAYLGINDTGQVKKQMDTLGINWAHEWTGVNGNVDYGNHIYGGASEGVTGVFPDLSQLCKFKSLEWFALPDRIPDNFHPGLFWQYHSTKVKDSITTPFNNTYDANDISPYCEFAKNDSFVKATFTTAEFGSPTTVHYGDVGRVILGMSDNRDPRRMLKYQINPFFAPVPGTNRYARDTAKYHSPDTAKAFSVTLFFNADTKTANIDTAFANHRPTDSLPLIRLQILYKRGILNAANPFDTGQGTIPLMPFKTKLDSTKAGWWKIIDTTITKAIYDNLPDDWHAPDSLENKTLARSWKFKQLHVILKDIPPTLRDYLDGDNHLYDPAVSTLAYANFGTDWENNYPAWVESKDTVKTFSTPDNLVDSIGSPNAARHIIECRVLSTYRTTIRVRSMTIQDTITDKFLYRKLDPLTGISHSCETNGNYGGFDSVVNATAADWSDSVGGRRWGIHFQDTREYNWKQSAAMIGYVDYFASKNNLYAHWHEQDNGGTSLYYRRNRLSYDGQPPSMFENEGQMFTGPVLCPGDYIFKHTQKINGFTAWPNTFDTSANGLVFTRRTADTATRWKGYEDFDTLYNGHVYYSRNVRNSNHTAQDHPKNKRSAIEVNMQAWGDYNSGVRWDPVHSKWIYDSVKPFVHIKQAFPEEIVGTTFAFLADGTTAFNNPQIFYLGEIYGGIPGMLHVQKWPVNTTIQDCPSGNLIKWLHNYNYGHIYSAWCSDVDHHYQYTHDTNDINGTLPNMYLGYSNNFLAQQRVMGRINQIYGSKNGNKYPLTRMTWLDAYSNNLAFRTTRDNFTASDSVSRAKAFLKVTKTQMVKITQRDSRRAFIDSAAIDSAWRTIAEVGLFKDSISPSLVNYAALVVNTRLYPSLMDKYDSGYYNAPFQRQNDSNRCSPIYGDIDTRKIYMKIDTTRIPAAFKSGYYVIRDTWHPDTTWLVKADSEFAVYIKPGEAKFLYIEKGVAITAGVGIGNGSSALEFAFNNGRRVAERLSATRDIITYTRHDSLFVSTPKRGTLVEGNDQHSDGDNITTGIETLLDDGATGKCHRPSICIGRDDKSVMIAYHKEPAVLQVAFQAHPDSAWKFLADPSVAFHDSTIDNSGVTPVCAPISDSEWVVVAAHQAEGLNPFGIVARRFKLTRILRSGVFPQLDLQIVNNFANPQYIYTDTGTDISRFPTVATRPIPDSCFPIRLAWQVAGKIRYIRFSWDTSGAAVAPIKDKDTIISTGLPSDCKNFHPSIATIGLNNFIRPLGTPGPLSLSDYVTWEAVLTDSPAVTSHGQFWPILRISSQPATRVKQTWQSSFTIFKPDTTSDGFRLPNVTASNIASNVTLVTPIPIGTKPKPIPTAPYKNFVQIVWENQTSERLELAMVNNGTWIKGGLLERGLTPSQALTTDRIDNFGTIPRSLVFIGQQPASDSGNGHTHVRVTNGWSPFIDTVQVMGTKLRFTVKANSKQCTFQHKMVTVLSDGLVGPIGGPSTGLFWQPTDPANGYLLPDGWPTGAPQNPAEVSSTNFPLNTNDQITINRSIAFDDTAQFRTHLNSPTDTVTITYRLRRSADSSAIGVIEQQIVTKDTIIAPGYGLNSAMALYLYTGVTDTGFVSVDITHSEADDLEREVYVLNDGDNLPLDAYKKVVPPKIAATPKQLSVSVVPNPFHSSTQIVIEPVENLPLSVTLYDELGRKVSELFNGIGDHERYEFSLTNSQLSAGIYYLRIQNGTTTATKKVEVLK